MFHAVNFLAYLFTLRSLMINSKITVNDKHSKNSSDNHKTLIYLINVKLTRGSDAGTGMLLPGLTRDGDIGHPSTKNSNTMDTINTSDTVALTTLKPGTHWQKVNCCRKRRQIGNEVDCRRYGRLRCRYGRLCRRFWQQIGNNLNSSACCGQRCRQLCQLCCQYGRLCRHHILHMTVRCSPIPGTINSDLLMLRLVLSCRLTRLSAIIVSTLSPSLATNRQQLEFGSLLRSTLSPTRSTMSPIRSTLSPNVERPFNFVATVYGAKVTKRTVLNSQRTHE